MGLMSWLCGDGGVPEWQGGKLLLRDDEATAVSSSCWRRGLADQALLRSGPEMWMSMMGQVGDGDDKGVRGGCGGRPPKSVVSDMSSVQQQVL